MSAFISFLTINEAKRGTYRKNNGSFQQVISRFFSKLVEFRLKAQEKKERTFTQRERPPQSVYLRYLGMDRINYELPIYFYQSLITC